jgi:hypothetical protein
VNLYGEVLYNTSRAFFFPLQGEEKYCTEGFKEIALMYGSTEEAYRKTSAFLNRIRHQEDGGTPSRTIRETTEHEGLLIQDHLEKKVSMIFQEHGFTSEGRPQASISATFAPPAPIVKKESVEEAFTPSIVPDRCQIDILNISFANQDAKGAVETSVDGVVVEALNEVVSAHGLSDRSRIDMLKNPVSYEDVEDAVNISVDDVGAKKQKETREPNPHGPPSKKKRAYVHNTVMHVEHGGGFYRLHGYGVGGVLRLLLAFLLHNRLLSHRCVFFVEGHTLYSSVMAFFSWYTNMSVILDWYHGRKKCRELLSMALQGSKIRHAVLGQLMPLLWYGLVDQAIDYRSTIPKAWIKNHDERIHLMTYLDKNRPMIPVSAVRRELGLRHSSNRGEKSNDLLVAQRQKHHGMSWSTSGSVALASVTAVKKNKTYKMWFRERKLEFKLVS